MAERKRAETLIAENRKAFHDYHILDTYEGGHRAARHRGQVHS